MDSTRAPRLLGIGAFFYPYRGLRFLLSHPRLLSYVAIPVGVNTLLYALLVWVSVSRFDTWLEALVPRGEGWYWVALFYLLAAVFAVVLFLAVVYTFTLVGNLLLAPFNDLLSEKVEWIYTGHRLEEPFRLKALAADLVRSLKAEIGRLALFLTGLAVLFALNFFPPLGPAVAAPCLTAYTLFFVAWEYLDYSMERRRFTFADKRRTAVRNVPAYLSFGAGASLLLVIPLLNLLAIPVCVVGATLLFCDLARGGRLPREGPAPGAAPSPPARRAS
ncbi:MAG: EI24 domain-containing protein [Deferrisomatales bacterium]